MKAARACSWGSRLITALQLFHSYVTFTRHAAETADAPGRAAPQAAGLARTLAQ